MITRNKNRSCNWGNLQFIFYLLSVCLFTGVSASYSQITLSEIMYDPIGNENYDEFIEIYNLSPTESIELRGWLISDGTGIDAIKDAGQGTVLAPGQFGLILDPQYFSNSTSYNSVIPPEALVLTIDNNTLGSGGLSNSTAETISLINPAGQTVASYTYSLGNAPGHSDEKIVLAGPDIPDNWADSRVLLGTPGFKNSVTPVELNLAVTAENISFSPARPGPGDEVTITAWIHNSGTDSTGNFQVYFYEDIDEDSLPEVGEDLGPPVTVSQVLAPKDSVIVSMVWSNVKSGFHQILVQLVLSGDADTSNNRAVKALPVSFPPRSLIINEIMYRPASGEAEWVEFYNPNEQAINLRGWGLTDSRPQARVVITNKSAEVKPGEFVIVAEDSTIFNSFPEISCLVFIPPKGFPALNNNYDSVVLSDLTGLAVDSLAYRASWGGELGVSLERIRYHGPSNDAKNWASSRDSSGGTPGRKNSVCPLEFDLSVTPKGFTFIPSIPNAGEAVRLSVIIHNLGSQAASHFQVRFFDDTNLDSLPDLDEEIGRVSVSETILPGDSSRISYVWTEVSSGFHRLIVAVDFELDQNTKNNFAAKDLRVRFKTGDLVINEIMYCPLPRQPEWVELYNPTDKSIDLYQWRISDAEPSRASVISVATLEVPSEGYVIIASDSSLLWQYPDIPVPVLVPVPALPALNNDFDAVSLYDLTGQIIDSLAYFSSWGSRYGVSLERIYWERKTQDSTNWRLSSAALGATPGQVNSASPFEVDLAISPQGISFEPAQPKFGQEVLVSVEIKNVGRESVSGYKVRFFDDANQDSVLQEIEELVAPVLSYEVLANEVSQVIQVTLEPLSSGIHSLYILVEHPWDQNRNNDSASVELKVGFLAGDVIINEIMYAPLAGYGEWVELYNPSLKSINLRQWSLADADALVSLGNRSIELPPAGYAVIAADSSVRDFFGPFTAPLLIPSKSLPALNNDFDTIMILDFNGNRIDSLTYYSSWGGEQGVSLERINPRLSSTDSSNWSSCVFAKGGTPGERNSIFTQVVPASTELSISPNPFSPDSDGRDDFAVISYSLPLTTASVNIKIFDVRGRLVRTLFNNEPSGAQRSVIWDGRDDNNQVLRMGIYIVYLEALNSLAGVIQTAKKTVVLAKKL